MAPPEYQEDQDENSISQPPLWWRQVNHQEDPMCGRMDLTRYSRTLHAHDFTPGGNSRVVMIRKKEQRTFASSTNGQEPVFETLTKETVQTFRGNKVERKITSQKRDSQESDHNMIDSLSLISLNSDETPKKNSLSFSTPKKSSVTNGSSRNSPHRNGLVRSTSLTNGTPKKIWFNGSGSIEAPSTNGTPKKPAVRKRIDSTVLSAADIFAKECLDAHNEMRALHKSPPLKLSKKLCKYSEEWARYLASRGEMQHRSESSYGENLFLIWNPGHTVTGGVPVQYWYQEIKDHVFGQEPTTLKTGHFTQVVWVESEELGVGVAKSRNGQIFVVANYDPPGNFIGSFAENVPPVGGFTEVPKSLASEVKNDQEFLEDMLKLHNDYRAKHGSPPLKINRELCDYAQEWAVKLAKDGRLEHRPRNPYGENLFCMCSTHIANAKDACCNWYAESKGFLYGFEPKAPCSGHFTQMIWSDSREIGVGRAKSKTGKVIIVANYKPRGNIFGQFSANVHKPIH